MSVYRLQMPPELEAMIASLAVELNLSFEQCLQLLIGVGIYTHKTHGQVFGFCYQAFVSQNV